MALLLTNRPKILGIDVAYPTTDRGQGKYYVHYIVVEGGNESVKYKYSELTACSTVPGKHRVVNMRRMDENKALLLRQKDAGQRIRSGVVGSQ